MLKVTAKDFSGVRISDHKFYTTEFVKCNFSGANFKDAKLVGGYFEGCSFRGAILDGASIYSSFSQCDFTNAELMNCDDRGFSRNGCQGIIDPSAWMSLTFEHSDLGYEVFMAHHDATLVQPGFHYGDCNQNRAIAIGSGITFGKKAALESMGCDIYAATILWSDLASICVPYNPKGVARCGKLMVERLVKKVING